MPGPTSRRSVVQVRATGTRERADTLVTEEPLEIRVRDSDGSTRPLAVTMRTPGSDFELAAGFLHTEGIISGPSDLETIRYCVKDPSVDELTNVGEVQNYNALTVRLRDERSLPLDALERYFVTTSACGVCGKASIDQISARGIAPVQHTLNVDAALLASLPDALTDAQRVFGATGGLHAAGLFTSQGELLQVREDVGRHNALDKLIGWGVLNGHVPLIGHIVMVSGRASFELVQKAVVGGAEMLCAVSAPSSLAVSTAEEFGLTLVGFLRGAEFNVYTDPGRIQL